MTAAVARRTVFREPAASARRATRAQAKDAPDRFVVMVMTALLVVGVVFQTFIIPFGGSLLFFDVVPLYGAVAVLLFAGRLHLSATRLVLYLLSFGTAIVLQVSVVRNASLSSMFLAMVIYAAYLGVVPASRATYMRILANFQYVVVAVCLLIYLDVVVQFAHLDMPDINRFVPASMLVQSYNYIQPLIYGMRFMKPNAFFMLEASFASQFVALGLVIECAIFQRWKMVVAMAIALLATFATTGVLLVLASLPFVARRYWRQALALGAVLLPLLLVGAYASGWLEVMQTRAENIDRTGSSFAGRFVIPYTAMWELATKGTENDIIAGYGAGATTRLLEIAEYTTISRSFVEYGFLFFVFFMTFLNYCFFSTGVPALVMWAVFVNYHFLSGNFHLSSSVIYCFVLTAAYAIRTPDRFRLGRETRPAVHPAGMAQLARSGTARHDQVDVGVRLF